MPIQTNQDGQEWFHTGVRIPKLLHDQAIERRISMSATLTRALEKECGGVEPLPHGQAPTALSSTPGRSKGQ